MNHAQSFLRLLIKDTKVAHLLDDIDCMKRCLKEREQALEEAKTKLNKTEQRYGLVLRDLHVSYIKEQRAQGNDISLKHILPSSGTLLEIQP